MSVPVLDLDILIWFWWCCWRYSDGSVDGAEDGRVDGAVDGRVRCAADNRVDGAVDDRIDGAVDRRVDVPSTGLVDIVLNGRVDGFALDCGAVDGRVDGAADFGAVDGRAHGCVDGRIEGRAVYGRVDGSDADGSVNKSQNNSFIKTSFIKIIAECIKKDLNNRQLYCNSLTVRSSSSLVRQTKFFYISHPD